MKTLVFALFLLGSSAFAADSVKITSFYYLETGTNRSPAAELCGVLTQPTGRSEIVTITSDPKGKDPGIYTTLTNKSGKFCAVIATYSGTADAELAR